MDQYVPIAEYPTRFEAEIVRSLLKSHQVDAMVVSHEGNQDAPVKVYVNHRDVDTAIGILKYANN